MNQGEQLGKKKDITESRNGGIGGREKQIPGTQGDMEAVGGVDGFNSPTDLLAIFQIIMNKGRVMDEFDTGCDGHSIFRRKP